MIFEVLYGASKRGELLLVDGGMCNYHLMKNGRLVIYEIISTKRGAGTVMLEKLKMIKEVNRIEAKCPTDLASNKWYEKKGFLHLGIEKLDSGREVNIWRLIV